MKKKLVAYSVLFSTKNLDDSKKPYVKFLNENYTKKHKLNISEFINLVPQKSLVLILILWILRKIENTKTEIRNTFIKTVEQLFFWLNEYNVFLSKNQHMCLVCFCKLYCFKFDSRYYLTKIYNR